MLTMVPEKTTTNGTGWKYPNASPFVSRILVRAHEARMTPAMLLTNNEAATSTVAKPLTRSNNPWLDAGLQLPGCRALGRRFDPRSSTTRAPRVAQKSRFGGEPV